jgi:hypothetical protein
MKPGNREKSIFVQSAMEQLKKAIYIDMFLEYGKVKHQPFAHAITAWFLKNG